MIITNDFTALNNQWPNMRVMDHRVHDYSTDGTPDGLIWFVRDIEDHLALIKNWRKFYTIPKKIIVQYMAWTPWGHNVRTRFEGSEVINLSFPNYEPDIHHGYAPLATDDTTDPVYVLAHDFGVDEANVIWAACEAGFDVMPSSPVDVKFPRTVNVKSAQRLILVDPSWDQFRFVQTYGMKIVAILAECPETYQPLFDRNDTRILKRTLVDKTSEEDGLYDLNAFGKKLDPDVLRALKQAAESNSNPLALRPEVTISNLFSKLLWRLK